MLLRIIMEFFERKSLDGKLVRIRKCFSKKRIRFEKHLDIFQAYNNFMKIYDNNTPMMKEDKTNEIWKLEDFFMYR